jgi:hypothetical protein
MKRVGYDFVVLCGRRRLAEVHGDVMLVGN